MKEFDLGGITNLQALREGTSEWYYALDCPNGDLYEAEELFLDGRPVRGSRFFLVHFPDGEVIQPLEPRPGFVIGEPVYFGQRISFPAVDFEAKEIRIYRFDCQGRTLETAAVLPLSSVENCYNLRLHEHPLTLTRQPNDGTFELVWPERRVIAVDPKESFFYREDDRLFFSIWFEDPDYREEVIIRDVHTGEIKEQMPGDIHIMPDGELWHLK